MKNTNHIDNSVGHTISITRKILLICPKLKLFSVGVSQDLVQEFL